MSFSTRNSFYLRISKSTVLPLYIYLDERHVNWMSDKILQHVLSDLRPQLLSKLKAEADALTGGSSSKKATVDTHRGDTYQFCYFIRKTEPHSVVIKTRHFRAAPPQRTKKVEAAINPSTSKTKKGKRKETVQDESPTRRTRSKKRRTGQPSTEIVNDDDNDVIMNDTQNADAEVIQQDEDAPGDLNREPVLELQIEEVEEKPKPILGLTYQGFSIYGHCLCVVVEPWPVVRSMTGVSSAPSRETPFGPPKGLPSQSRSNVRGQTPLFLPEEPEGEENQTASGPAGQHINKHYLDQVLHANEVSDDEDDVGGMMEFSQVLHNVGGSRAGAINDDEDMDGSVLFGDADEFREL